MLVLRYYADLSEAQIAATLEISAGTVKAHAHRGLSTLRRSMTDHHTLHARPPGLANDPTEQS